MLKAWFCGTAAAFIIATTMNASPAQADDFDDCNSGAPQRMISGCTHLIETGQIDGRPISTRNLAAAYNNRGIAFFEDENYRRSILDHTEAIRLDPLNSAHFSGRGNAYVHLGEYELALQDHTEAVRLDPQNSAAYYNRGLTHFLYQSFADAVLDLKRAMVLEPANAPLRQSLGDAYYFTGDVPAALSEWTEACALASPRQTELWQNRLSQLGFYDGYVDGHCSIQVVDAFEACARSGCFF